MHISYLYKHKETAHSYTNIQDTIFKDTQILKRLLAVIKPSRGSFLFCIEHTDYKININIQEQCKLLIKEHPEVKLTMWTCTTQFTLNSQV